MKSKIFNVLQLVFIIVVLSYVGNDFFFRENVTKEEIIQIHKDYEKRFEEYQSRDSIESKILDSLRIFREHFENDLYDLRYQNYKTRESNEKTYKIIDSLSTVTGTRPQF